MRRRLLSLSLLVVASVAAAASWRATHRPVPARVAAADSAPDPARLRDIDIAFWERRAGEDTLGAEDRVMAAALLMQRARETGSYVDYLRADSLVRASVRIRPQHNQKGYVLLASTLMAQHRFAEAYEVAVQLDSMTPGIPGYAALRGEIALELGRYDDARHAFDAARGGDDGAVIARIARFEEVEGHTETARALLVSAARKAERAAELPAEQRAWYRLRVADLDMRHGHLTSADSLLRIALAASPEDHRLLGAAARLAWMRGDWQASADYGERAVARTLDPATLALLSDDYAALGDSAKAAEFAGAMRMAVMSQTGPLHRAWSLFLLDHGQDAAGVLARSREELRTRRDVYGYDVEAWALHALRRDGEAWSAAQRALAQGTEDATLEYHAGVIAESSGRAAEARAHLQRALAINASFHPQQAPDARRRLAALPSMIAAVEPSR